MSDENDFTLHIFTRKSTYFLKMNAYGVKDRLSLRADNGHAQKSVGI